MPWTFLLYSAARETDFTFTTKPPQMGKLKKKFHWKNFQVRKNYGPNKKKYKGIETPEMEEIISQNYFQDGSGCYPRYYQQNAVKRTIEAVAKKQQQIILVMATGTDKTYTAFQIIYRLWKRVAKNGF